MFVKAGPGSNLNEGLENSASTEDLTSRAFTISAGSHNSTACKLELPPLYVTLLTVTSICCFHG